jgi:hypothetical protein
MYELGIDKDVLNIEVKKTLKRFLNKKTYKQDKTF